MQSTAVSKSNLDGGCCAVVVVCDLPVAVAIPFHSSDPADKATHSHILR